jgi:hypothetical protein
MNLAELIKSIETVSAPFEKWQPSHCGDIDIVIKANGQWYFHGSLITREKMVKLFASVLINEDGHYYLKTPVEKMRIRVEDAPFLITQWYKKDDYIVCCDNLAREFVLSAHHPITIKEQIPYLTLHHGLSAKISRSVFYQWAEIATEQQGRFTIQSGGTDYYIG